MKYNNLIESTIANDIEATRELLVAGNNPNLIICKNGYFPIHIAISNENKEMIELLIEFKAHKNKNVKKSSQNGFFKYINRVIKSNAINFDFYDFLISSKFKITSDIDDAKIYSNLIEARRA